MHARHRLSRVGGRQPPARASQRPDFLVSPWMPQRPGPGEVARPQRGLATVASLGDKLHEWRGYFQRAQPPLQHRFGVPFHAPTQSYCLGGVGLPRAARRREPAAMSGPTPRRRPPEEAPERNEMQRDATLTDGAGRLTWRAPLSRHSVTTPSALDLA